MTNHNRARIAAGCQVTMTTYGGKQVWTTKAEEWFEFSFIVARNEGYMVVQSGLNYYVFEAAKVLETEYRERK